MVEVRDHFMQFVVVRRSHSLRLPAFRPLRNIKWLVWVWLRQTISCSHGSMPFVTVDVRDYIATCQ